MSALPPTARPSSRAQARGAAISRALSRRFSALLDRAQPSEMMTLLLTAIVVGLLTGLAAVLMFKLIGWIGLWSFGVLPQLAPWLGRGWLILIPALGGLIAGPLLASYVQEARGSGIPAVMEALVLQGGRIRARVILSKTLLTSITIGAGGSAGREGPIVQVGSAIGSALAQLLRLSENRTRNLVACGAAAGIAAAFNAPIAGVAFAIEVMVGELGLGMLGNVIISAVAAAIVSQAFLGAAPAFSVPIYGLNAPGEILFYVLLGIIASIWGVFFIRVFYAAGDWFERLHRPPAWLKPALGGLGLGLLGFTYPLLLPAMGIPAPLARSGLPVAENIPHIFGSGFDVTAVALVTALPCALLLSLLFLKLAGTALTLGAGSAGGVFAPSLFMGVMLGGLFGQGVERLYPASAIDPSAFALAGMAAVLTAATRAPLTSIIIAFELSNSYSFILPLMATTIFAAITAHRLHPESIYTLRLVRRGIRLRHGRDVDVLDSVLVNEIMGSDPPTVSATMSLRELAAAFEATHHHGFIVLDQDGRLAGVVTLQDLNAAGDAGAEDGSARVADVMTRTLLLAYPDESIGAALQRMAVRDVGRLPVVDRKDAGRLLGVVRRSDIVRAYRYGVTRRDDLQDRANQLRISRREGGTEFVELSVHAGSEAAGKRVAELKLPAECLLTTRRRGDRLQLLHGNDVLNPGDVVLALCEPSKAPALRALFQPKSSP